MKWHGLKIPIILLALVAGLMVLLGGQWAYNKYSLHNPLEQKLGAMDFIVEYTFDHDGETPVVNIKFDSPANLPGNLMEEYEKVNELMKKIVNKGAFQINLIDQRDQVLKDIYYESQFVIQEAIIQGNYRQMAALVHESALSAGAEAKIYIGTANIYLQMEHGDNYLYEIIPRETLPGALSPVRGGGGVVYD